jgi:hypothetical protein
VVADHPGLAVELVGREPDVCVLAVSGQLSPGSAGLVTGAVSKALLDVGQVLVDVSGLRLTWTPAVHLFPSAMSAMGGWPWARLVLFGAGAGLAETLRAQQVSATVPLAPDQTTARQLLRRRRRPLPGTSTWTRSCRRPVGRAFSSGLPAGTGNSTRSAATPCSWPPSW